LGGGRATWKAARPREDGAFRERSHVRRTPSGTPIEPPAAPEPRLSRWIDSWRRAPRRPRSTPTSPPGSRSGAPSRRSRSAAPRRRPPPASPEPAPRSRSGRDLGPQLARGLGALLEPARRRLPLRAVARERQLAAQRLEQDHAKREQIRRGAERLTQNLLRRHVRDAAHAVSPESARVHLAVQRLRQAEVGDGDAQLGALPAHHDVVALQIAMQHPRRVRGSESRQDLARDFDHDRDLHRACPEHLAEAQAVDIFHGEEVQALVHAPCLLVHAHVVHTADVGMADAASQARLRQQSVDGVRVVGDGREQRLQRDPFRQHTVERQIHLAHAAAPDEALDLVATGDHLPGPERRHPHTVAGRRRGRMIPVVHRGIDQLEARRAIVEVRVDGFDLPAHQAALAEREHFFFAQAGP
jgi:hypothetical protein